MRLFSLTIPFVCIWAAAARAQSVDHQVQAEIRRFVAAVNQGNPRAVADLYVNDRRTTTAGDGEIYVGWQRVADLLRQVYAQAGRIELAVDSITVMPLGKDAAVAVMRCHWLFGRDRREVTGAMTLVYARQPAGWRLAHDHTSTLEASAPQENPEVTPIRR
jgi:uncharacterized protein (TIGR02246 family)